MRRFPAGLILLFILLAATPVAAAATGRAGFSSRPHPTPSPTSTPTPTPAPASGFTIVSSPNPDPSESRLDGVAVVSAADAWAVGRAGSSTLAEHWNGSQWNVVPTPNVQGSIFNELRSVAAVSSSDVWAAGSASTTNNNFALIEHWDGTQWSMVPTSQIPGQSAGPSLNAIAAVSASDVWAVGGSFDPQVPARGEQAFLLHWDGQAWTQTAAPAETSSWSSSTRSGVAAVSSSDVWAVGDFFAFHWDGSAWSVSGASSQKAVTAADATDVWAVGTATYCDNEGGGCTSSPTALRWNGSQWLSTFPVGVGGFAAAAAVDAADVWAVGGGQAQNWNGSAWSVIPTPSVSGATLALQGVAGSSAHDVWAVGYSQGPGLVVGTLIEHFTG